MFNLGHNSFLFLICKLSVGCHEVVGDFGCKPSLFLIQQINNTSEVGALARRWIPEPISGLMLWRGSDMTFGK